MQRFSRALDVPGGDRIGVRLAIAQVFLRQGHFEDVRRQLGLGFSEAKLNDSPVTPDDILEAANIFLAMHDFELAESYFDKARLAGASTVCTITGGFLDECVSGAGGYSQGRRFTGQSWAGHRFPR